ncbi:low temperature requirement protein A [Demequina sp. NBRC 110056]|uniref:low temperature requirement protein A n=1 Tax=Demequina sp. NBRC 110056 TaxID=1570345 RepID=UPI0009FEA587|nr:low temperature requirement protein A [Demequina sp. NBRC 110056]
MSDTEGSAGTSEADTTDAAERHASWPELFFDLVVVAGAGLLGHLIEDSEGLGSIALFAIAFGAFWMIWTCFTAYGNVRGDDARLPTFLAGMIVLGVMVAAVPGIHDEHAHAFAIAYIVGRVIAARPWHGAAVVVDLPVIQAATGVLPWIVSLWFDGDAMYVWWAIGLTLDLAVLLRSRPDRVAAGAQARLDHAIDGRRERLEAHAAREERPTRSATRARRRAERRQRRLEVQARRGRGPRDIPTSIVALRADTVHLAERFGLFTLILLGEGLIQVITSASGAEWNRELGVAALGAFAFIVGLWNLSVRRGSAGLALLPEGAIPVRLQWVAHLVTSLCIVAMAAVMGAIVADPGAEIDDHVAAVLVTALAVYLLAAGTTHAVLARRGHDRAARLRAAWLLGAGVVAPLAAWLAHGYLDASAVVWILAAAVVTCGVAASRLTADR